jgi:hypothetical protein
VPPVPSSRPDPTRPTRSLRAPRKGPSQDYRLMVDAIQAGDLETARNAYGQLMERLGGTGAAADGALARIGASLRRGDLIAANRTLDRLESKALLVLRGLREHADLIAPRGAVQGSARKAN